MSYRIRLFLTHMATAFVAGTCVWCGFQAQGLSQLAFMLLFAAGIAVPSTLAAWWLTRGLHHLESSLADPHSASDTSGLREFDQVIGRLQTVLDRQRALVQNVDELVMRLGHTTSGSQLGRSAGDSHLLTDALGQLSRASARDVGLIMSLGDDMAKGAHDTHRGAREQTRMVENAIGAVEILSGKIDIVSSEAQAAGSSAQESAEQATKGLKTSVIKCIPWSVRSHGNDLKSDGNCKWRHRAESTRTVSSKRLWCRAAYWVPWCCAKCGPAMDARR